MLLAPVAPPPDLLLWLLRPNDNLLNQDGVWMLKGWRRARRMGRRQGRQAATIPRQVSAWVQTAAPVFSPVLLEVRFLEGEGWDVRGGGERRTG